MGNTIENIMIEMIKKHHSPLSKNPYDFFMFYIHINENFSLELFTKQDKIHLLLRYKDESVDIALIMLDFNSHSGVEQITFKYDQYDFLGYVDKRKAFVEDKIVFGFEPTETTKKILSTNALSSLFRVCNALSKATLDIIKQLLEKENLGITLSDFGYINCTK